MNSQKKKQTNADSEYCQHLDNLCRNLKKENADFLIEQFTTEISIPDLPGKTSSASENRWVRINHFLALNLAALRQHLDVKHGKSHKYYNIEMQDVAEKRKMRRTWELQQKENKVGPQTSGTQNSQSLN